jgi:hypothetical protein
MPSTYTNKTATACSLRIALKTTVYAVLRLLYVVRHTGTLAYRPEPLGVNEPFESLRVSPVEVSIANVSSWGFFAN